MKVSKDSRLYRYARLTCFTEEITSGCGLIFGVLLTTVVGLAIGAFATIPPLLIFRWIGTGVFALFGASTAEMSLLLKFTLLPATGVLSLMAFFVGCNLLHMACRKIEIV